MREKPYISPLIYLKVSLILLPHIVCQGISRFKNVQDRNRLFIYMYYIEISEFGIRKEPNTSHSTCSKFVVYISLCVYDRSNITAQILRPVR